MLVYIFVPVNNVLSFRFLLTITLLNKGRSKKSSPESLFVVFRKKDKNTGVSKVFTWSQSFHIHFWPILKKIESMIKERWK